MTHRRNQKYRMRRLRRAQVWGMWCERLSFWLGGVHSPLALKWKDTAPWLGHPVGLVPRMLPKGLLAIAVRPNLPSRAATRRRYEDIAQRQAEARLARLQEADRRFEAVRARWHSVESNQELLRKLAKR